MGADANTGPSNTTATAYLLLVNHCEVVTSMYVRTNYDEEKELLDYEPNISLIESMTLLLEDQLYENWNKRTPHQTDM